MKAVGIGQLRGDTRNYIERVATGETFEVMRRGLIVGRLYPAHGLHERLIPVSVTEFRTRAGFFVGRVAAGETIALAYNGKTVAAIRPLPPTGKPTPRRHPAATHITALG